MNMLIKEECEKALENLRILERKDNFKKWGGQVSPQINCDVVEQLIKEHFELEQNFKILEKNYDDIYDIVHCSEPYKFEELKKGMWVWDDKLNACFLIKELKPQSYWNVIIYANYLTDTFEEMHFEKNRFYPVTKSMEYQK